MFKEVSIGENTPQEVNVIIEIPANSEPVKYEVDKDSGRVFVDRFMGTSMRYPCDYGYVPETLSEDGDPLDVLVLCPQPLIPGSVITTRPVGMLQMTDESGKDCKILAVPINKISPLYSQIHSPQDVHPHTLSRIAHFFEHYKDLEDGKWVKIEAWEGPEQAIAEILASIARHDSTK
ncbi:MAG: inorganic diphosphatase [Francisellaceae bacterium]|jgi:inorganic pyrophosphatase|nr:inorganic diphosphatase [Francisellaceae bacterium]MBT6208011.1 inorganic diphosphatase [Francisellaceae bacterium]MBT6538304.1 inorganic diphosphatase [Francisellaceae bacterium]